MDNAECVCRIYSTWCIMTVSKQGASFVHSILIFQFNIQAKTNFFKVHLPSSLIVFANQRLNTCLSMLHRNVVYRYRHLLRYITSLYMYSYRHIGLIYTNIFYIHASRRKELPIQVTLHQFMSIYSECSIVRVNYCFMLVLCNVKFGF